MFRQFLKQVAAKFTHLLPLGTGSSSKEQYWSLLRWLMPNGGTFILLLLYISISRTWGAPATNPPLLTGATEINFSGYLADDNGNPLDGPHDITVAIYSQPTPTTGETPLWGPEPHLNVPVTEGNWTVGIGSVLLGGIPTTLWSGDRYLQITVEGEVLSPRQLIRSVPIAGLALTVPDRAITASKLALDAIPGEATHVQPTETISVGPIYQVFPSTNTEITVTQRSNILITGKGNAVTTGTGGYFAGLCRDGVGVAPTHNYTPDVALAPPYEKFTWTWIDIVEPGTYTYAICVGNSSNPTTVNVSWYRAVINLVAFPAP